MSDLRIKEVFGDLPTLETSRLVLRRITPDDLFDVFDYASDPEVARHVSWEHHLTTEDSRQFISLVEERYARGEVSPWGMIDRARNRLIGTCGYVSWQPAHARAEIGYALARRYWGRGLMTEAVREIIRFGFDRMQLNRIEAHCLLANTASERVMQKVGMTFEGILREAMLVKGQYRDLKLYSLLRREYFRR